MKKKTFIVQLLNSKKPSRTSFTQVEDANFYSNDTDASLVFIPHEDTFDFQSAKVVMYNRSDESLVERDAVVTTENGRKVASYELPEEIILHWGEWVAQPVFISAGEIYSGSIVPFSVIRYLMDNRPPTLRDVIKIDELYSQLVTVMDEISDKDVISAPEIIGARGGFDKLNDRLNHFEQTFSDGGPSIFYDTLAELNSAYPNGSTGVALIGETNPAKIYVWDGDVWKSYGDYQGIELKEDSVDTSNLKTNSVTFNKSSYIEVIGKNILNPENLTLGHTISSNNGNSYVSADYLYTDFIPVLPSTSYHRTMSSVVFYDANKNFISGTTRSAGSFTTPNNVAYIIAVIKIEEFPTAQIEIGTVQTYYEPFKVTIKNLEISMDEVEDTIKQAINDYPSIKESVEGLYVSSKNLFNFQDVVNGYMLSAGQLVENSNYSVSGFIPVEEESNYIANRTITVNFYDRNKVYILGSQKSVVVGDYFTSHVGAIYMRIAIPTNAVDTTQVEEGTVTTSFEKYFEPHIPSQKDSELTGKKILFIGDSNTHLNNFPQRIADRTGAVTYNGGAGGTRLTDFSMVNTTNNYHKFNGCAIADAIATGNWTVLETAASEIDVAENQDRIPKYRAQLQNIQDACADMNNLDAIVLKYGTNDVNNSGFSLGDPDSEDRATWNGAINYFIKTIQSVYPHVKIHFCAPVFRELMPQSVENTGSPKNSDEWAKSVMLPDMVEAMRERTKENHVPFLDLYNESGINQYTAIHYLKDKTHYSVSGDVLIAQKVENFLLRG